MSVLFFLASFGLGFSVCLILLGKSEQAQLDRIRQLEQDKKELQIKYLDSCWGYGPNRPNFSSDN